MSFADDITRDALGRALKAGEDTCPDLAAKGPAWMVIHSLLGLQPARLHCWRAVSISLSGRLRPRLATPRDDEPAAHVPGSLLPCWAVAVDVAPAGDGSAEQLNNGSSPPPTAGFR